MPPTLQDVVDDLASRAGRAIDVEDRRFRLLAHSAHDGPVDAVRRDTILRRSATPAVITRLERLGVPAARGPVRLPAAPELGMGARLCLPVCEGNELLGFVWVLDDPPLPEVDADHLSASLTPVAAALVALRDQDDVRLTQEQQALTALLARRETGPAGELLGQRAPVTVVVAAPATDLTSLRRAAGPGRAITGEHDGLAVALLTSADVPEIPGAVLGVGVAAATLSGAPAGLEQATVARKVALAVPRFGPVARFAALGPYALLAPLAFPRDGSPPPALPAALATLDAAPDGAELLGAVQAMLDAGEDIAGAAARLNVHRSTLHRRLRRAEQLMGVDLADGGTRLELHAGLVLAELLAGAR